MKSKKSVLKALAQGSVTREELPGLLEKDQGILIWQDGILTGNVPIDPQTNRPLTYAQVKERYPNRLVLHITETDLVRNE